MISRRNFLIAMSVQPLLLSNLIVLYPKKPLLNLFSAEAPEFIVISGWVFLKSDLPELES